MFLCQTKPRGFLFQIPHCFTSTCFVIVFKRAPFQLSHFATIFSVHTGHLSEQPLPPHPSRLFSVNTVFLFCGIITHLQFAFCSRWCRTDLWSFGYYMSILCEWRSLCLHFVLQLTQVNATFNSKSVPIKQVTSNFFAPTSAVDKNENWGVLTLGEQPAWGFWYKDTGNRPV